MLILHFLHSQLFWFPFVQSVSLSVGHRPFAHLVRRTGELCGRHEESIWTDIRTYMQSNQFHVMQWHLSGTRKSSSHPPTLPCTIYKIDFCVFVVSLLIFHVFVKMLSNALVKLNFFCFCSDDLEKFQRNLLLVDWIERKLIRLSGGGVSAKTGASLLNRN